MFEQRKFGAAPSKTDRIPNPLVKLDDGTQVENYFSTHDRPATHVMRSKYYAVGTGRLLELMRRAGFASVERLDGRFYQPVLVGSREA